MSITSSRPDSGEFVISIGISHDHPRSTMSQDLTDAIASATATRDVSGPVQVWVEQVREGDDALIAHEVRPYRDLLQLRRALPAPPSGIETRALDPARDIDELIEVNNRAFSWHPEQSGLTRSRFEATMREPWFELDGFRILELEDRIAGFCWTKVHADESPVLGEIYVIAVDPDFHGRGLGGPMTLAGLEWLTAQNITLANLYVEADNLPALRTYDRLGFSTHSTNRAYTSAAPGTS